MGSGFQDFINKYGGDDKITNKDIRDFGDSGGSQEKAEAYLKKIESQQDTKNKTAAGVKIGDKAYVAADKAKNFGSSTGGGVSDTGGSGGSSDLYSGTDIDLGAYDAMKGIDFQYQDALNQGLYNSQNNIATINATANSFIGAAQRDASMYASDASVQIADLTSGRGLEGTKYLADQNRLAAENVASIQGAYSLDLQTIINAGLKDVETVRGEYGLAGTELAGEYGLESDRIKGDTARDVAQKQKEAQLYGSLFSSFSF